MGIAHQSDKRIRERKNGGQCPPYGEEMSIENINPNDGTADAADEMLLSRYLEGRLEGAQKQTVEEQLRSSAAARRRLDALREEEKLLREALETLSEPTKRLGDKVIAALHNDERQRIQALRSRRWRRNAFAIMSAAATIVLCVWLVRPRDSMATVASGTPATLVTPVGERKALTKNSRIYEGDDLVTIQGQFVRLSLNADSAVDIDENSRVEFQKYNPSTLSLESGRIGLAVPEGESEVTVRLPQGSVRAAAGSLLDIWLPQPSATQWPEVLELLSTGAKTAEVANTNLPAVITVISGAAVACNETFPSGVSISAGNRVFLTPNDRKSRKVDMAASRVIETRRGRSWHALDGVGPQDRTVIGLLDKPNFVELGQRLGLTRNTGKDVADALEALQQASQTIEPYVRAEKLAPAQQQLRLAYEALEAGDERRPFGRMLEGLAHMERGRALVARRSQDDLIAANAAFDAARVAFEEAMKISADATSAPAAGKPDWAAAIAAGPSVTLRDLSPALQSSMLASFHHALAKYWVGRTAGEANDSLAAAKEFETLRGDLGRSVESMAVRLAEGLAYKQAGKTQKAIEAYEEVLAMSTAGISEASRKQADGIRQATLLAFAKLYVDAKEPARARQIQQDYSLLFPLETLANSPVYSEIERMLNETRIEDAQQAMEAKKFDVAEELYSIQLQRNPGNTTTLIQLLGPVVELKKGNRAHQIVKELQDKLTPEKLELHKALIEKALALPVTPAEENPALLPVR